MGGHPRPHHCNMLFLALRLSMDQKSNQFICCQPKPNCYVLSTLPPGSYGFMHVSLDATAARPDPEGGKGGDLPRPRERQGPQMSGVVLREHRPSYINENRGSIAPLLFISPWAPYFMERFFFSKIVPLQSKICKKGSIFKICENSTLLSSSWVVRV
jgi:hypothetical protein